jgi:hypothetical protein
VYHNRYLVLGSWKYWAMGPLGDLDQIEGKTVTNRTWVGRGSPVQCGGSGQSGARDALVGVRLRLPLANALALKAPTELQ